MDAPYIFMGVIQNNTSIVQNRIDSCLPVKGGRFQCFHKIRIVVGNRNGLVRKSTIAAQFCRNGKHHDLRLIRNNRISNNGLMIQNQLRQFLSEIQIPCISIQCNILCITGNKIKICKMTLLLRAFYILHNLRLTAHAFQIRNPYLHLIPFVGNLIVQINV